MTLQGQLDADGTPEGVPGATGWQLLCAMQRFVPSVAVLHLF